MGYKVKGPHHMVDSDATCVRGDLLTNMKVAKFTAEDVEHIDEAICQIRQNNGSIAMPGLEWVRNKVAARAGVKMKDEGTIQYEEG